METFKDLFKNKKNVINTAVVIILFAGLLIGIYLARNPQILRGRAFDSPQIAFIGPAGSLVNLSGGKIGLKIIPGQAASVELRLTSPFGAPGTGSTQPTQAQITSSQPTTTQPTVTTGPTSTSAPNPTPAGLNTCNIVGLSEGQVLSGNYTLLVIADKSPQYYLADWIKVSTSTSPIQLGSTQEISLGISGNKPPGNGYHECRIQTTATGGEIIYSKRVNFTISSTTSAPTATTAPTAVPTTAPTQTPAGVTLTASTPVAPGGNITVTWSGVNNAIDPYWLIGTPGTTNGVYLIGCAKTQPSQTSSVPGSGTCPLIAPATAGPYTVEMYHFNITNSELQLIKISNQVIVSN